ncbi:MAG: hypothetical protein V4760_00780 [Bdellovibrionota bacterium]
MKKVMFLFAMVLMLVLSFAQLGQAQAGEKKVCKVSTNDIGTIVGKGSNSDAAFEDAATQCFDRRSKLYSMKNGGSVDEDSGLVMIDMCANIRCGG